MNLVKFLYALLIAYSTGKYPIKQLNSVADAKLLGHWLKDIPELKDAFNAYQNGNEIDTVALGNALRQYANEVYIKQEGAKASFKEVLLAFAKWFKTGSEGALKRLEKLSVKTNEPFTQQFFAKEIGDQTSIDKQLQRLVTKLGGDKGKNFLTPEQSDPIRKKNPAALKEYNRLRREYNKVWQDALSTYVRQSGKNTVPYQDVVKFLKKQGLEHNMPAGFTGNIDANGAWYTNDEKPINGKPSAIVFPTVRMNPEFGPGYGKDWVFVGIRKDGSQGNYFYTTEYRQGKSAKKFEKVKDLTPKLEKIRKSWMSNLQQFDEGDVRDVVSVILELLFQSSNRIGTPGGNKKTGGGFGLGTVTRGMVFSRPDGGYRFQYQGKDNIKTIFLLKPNTAVNKRLCQIMAELYEGKKPGDPFFTYKTKSGLRKPVLPATVNAYFKSLSGGLTVHKLRTYWGTKIFREGLDALFAKVKNVKSLKDGVMYSKKLGTMVGKRLNHVRNSAEGETTVTPNTALANYIDPGVQMELFEHYGLPLPKYLEKFMSEAAVEGEEENVDEGYDKQVLDTRLLEEHLAGNRDAVYNPFVE